MDWSIRRKPDGTPAGTAESAGSMGTYSRLLPTGRLEAFSDGVFAIAITLLVLELHVQTENLSDDRPYIWPYAA